MAHEHMSEVIMRDAYEAVARGEDVAAEHRLAILIHESNLAVIEAVQAINGNHNKKRRRDRIKEKALPYGGGVGLLSLVAYELLKLAS